MTRTKNIIIDANLILKYNDDDQLVNFEIINTETPIRLFDVDKDYWLRFFTYIQKHQNTHLLYLNPSEKRFYKLIFSPRGQYMINFIILKSNEDEYLHTKRKNDESIQTYFHHLKKDYPNSLLLYYRRNKFYTVKEDLLKTEKEFDSIDFMQLVNSIKLVDKQKIRLNNREVEVQPLFDQLGNQFVISLKK